MKKRAFLLALAGVLTISLISRAQETGAPKINTFTREQMKENWIKFTKDEGFSALFKDATSKGFLRQPQENTAWGFDGVVKGEDGKDQNVLFCAYDFYNPKAAKGQGCSMIWKKVGNRVYKAYVIFPEGEKDIQTALKGSMEWYADDNGKVQRAHSWNSCFLKCVQTNGTAPGLDLDIKNGKVKVGGSTFKLNCTGACFAGAIVCSGIAAGIAASGVGVPFAIAGLGICFAGTCSSCIALCALGCM